MIRDASVDAVGHVAMLAGALVEIGAAPTAFPSSLFDRLGVFLDGVPAETRGDREDDEESDANDLPEAYYLCERAAAAVLSRSVEARRVLPQKASLLSKIRRYQDRYGFLGKLLSVLDDEPLVIVHPSTQRGWRARMGGIADNFQLHALLRAELAGGGSERIAGERPAPAAIAAASDGSVDNAPGMQSDWQLASWRAIAHDGSIAGQDDTKHWIWNEGFPAEIEAFEGTRLIAIGPSTMQRSWNAGRIFYGMPGWLRVERGLTPGEAEALLSRISESRANMPVLRHR